MASSGFKLCASPSSCCFLACVLQLLSSPFATVKLLELLPIVFKSVLSGSFAVHLTMSQLETQTLLQALISLPMRSTPLWQASYSTQCCARSHPSDWRLGGVDQVGTLSPELRLALWQLTSHAILLSFDFLTFMAMMPSLELA